MTIGEDLKTVNTAVTESVQTVIEASGIVALSGIREIAGRTFLRGPRKRSEDIRKLGQRLALEEVVLDPTTENGSLVESSGNTKSAVEGEGPERWVSETGEGRITGNRRKRPKNGENERKPEAVVVSHLRTSNSP